MKTIWKYNLAETDEQLVEVPKGSKLLSVGNQNESLVLWAEVNPANKTTNATIKIFGTGQPNIDTQGLEFLGTVQMFGGGLVLHVYGTI